MHLHIINYANHVKRLYKHLSSVNTLQLISVPNPSLSDVISCKLALTATTDQFSPQSSSILKSEQQFQTTSESNSALHSGKVKSQTCHPHELIHKKVTY